MRFLLSIAVVALATTAMAKPKTTTIPHRDKGGKTVVTTDRDGTTVDHHRGGKRTGGEANRESHKENVDRHRSAENNP